MFAKIDKRYGLETVKRVLEADGYVASRERIAYISDHLGLGQRKFNRDGVPTVRSWSEEEVTVIQAVFAATKDLKIPYDLTLSLITGGEEGLDERLEPVRLAIRLSQALVGSTAA
jgi:hypothetical protein